MQERIIGDVLKRENTHCSRLPELHFLSFTLCCVFILIMTVAQE